MSKVAPSRSVGLWWLLLLAPVCLLAGWSLGQMPTGSSRLASSGGATGAAAALADPAAPPPETISRWTSFEHAMVESQRTGKPVMIDFSADGCGTCQALKRGVFEDAENGRAVQAAVIPVSIVDRTRENGENPADIEDLQRRYDVDAFPTLIVFSPRSGKTEKTRGFGGPERTVAWILQAAHKVR